MRRSGRLLRLRVVMAVVKRAPALLLPFVLLPSGWSSEPELRVPGTETFCGLALGMSLEAVANHLDEEGIRITDSLPTRLVYRPARTPDGKHIDQPWFNGADECIAKFDLRSEELYGIEMRYARHPGSREQAFHSLRRKISDRFGIPTKKSWVDREKPEVGVKYYWLRGALIVHLRHRPADEWPLRLLAYGGPYDAGVGAVSWPRIVRKKEARYPRQARGNGRVELRVLVSKKGAVDDLLVVWSRPENLGFEEAAAEAIRKWRYVPAKLNGKPVDAYITIIVCFPRP